MVTGLKALGGVGSEKLAYSLTEELSIYFRREGGRIEHTP